MARRRTANGAPKTGMEWPTTLSKNNAGPSISELLRDACGDLKTGRGRPGNMDEIFLLLQEIEKASEVGNHSCLRRAIP